MVYRTYLTAMYNFLYVKYFDFTVTIARKQFPDFRCKVLLTDFRFNINY